MTLEKQLNEISKMIATTKQLLVDNPDDEMLLYMLNQDKELYSLSIAKAYCKILPSFENAQDVIKTVYSESHNTSIDPFYVANFFNIEVKEDNLLRDGIGRCDFFEDKIVITYKPSNRYRDRFTIAHELGHIFLHFSQGLSTEFIDYESVADELVAANNTDYVKPIMSAARLSDNIGNFQKEQEANKFAGELLVPRLVLDKILNRLPSGKAINASLLKDLFNVSIPVIKIALTDYGLLNSGKVLNDINIKNRGW